MFFQLLYIHLFRPFLKYNQQTTPLPANVSPRKICTQAAALISKVLRLYKRSHGLRQIPNVAVYIAHSACTIHLLNLPDKIARRDIVHGVKHLEEIAEGWLCARRALGILGLLAKKWNAELPEEAAAVLQRSEQKFGALRDAASTPKSTNAAIAQPGPELQQTTSPAPPVYGSAAPTSPTSFVPNMNAPHIPITTTNPNAAYFATSAQISRRPSESFPFSPSAAQFALPHAQRRLHSSAGSTPPTTLSGVSAAQPRPSFDSANINTAGASPSEFWNGVDQLVKEGQDWWLRDQSQLASNWNSGFDNWNLSDSDISWLSNGNGAPNGAVRPTVSQASPAVNAHGPAPVSTMNSNVVNGNGSTAPSPAYGQGLSTLTGDLNGLSTYNEEDWYQ